MNWWLKYLPLIVLAGSILIAFVHLEDDHAALKKRMDFHFGQEW